ncbi:TonB-dependent receptor domain-containing protein [Phenylobacterium sp.]|uniref:TonB-dependent receptor domain-containing protein n=1 Tax=Phenylobacterium sp. TaxID=1871053 RepID=UPI002FE2B725
MGCSHLAAGASALALTAALSVGPAWAQDGEVEEIVVTGTLIGGAPTGAIPVQVFSSGELQKRGDPTPLEFVKNLPAVSNTVGESNRINGQNSGAVTVNLRGLGASRTLVLLNGHRLPIVQSAGSGVDVAMIPTAAIGRVEVLTDGAAATYGSDAIAGVVNYITKSNFDGLEIDATYNAIRKSAGDWSANVAWGTVGDWGNVLLTAGYKHRSVLQQDERDWGLYPQTVNPQSGWSANGSPGAYLTGATRSVAGFNQGFVDPGCLALGGVLTGSGNAARCQFYQGPFNNLVDEIDGYQVYGEVNFQVADEHRLHLEALASGHVVPREVQNPSYAPSNYPLATTAGGNNPFPAPAGTEGARGYYIPGNHPGLQTLIALNPGAFSAAQLTNIAANGVLTSNAGWRPYGYSGNPLTGEGFHSRREMHLKRFSGGLSGSLGRGISYEVNATWAEQTNERITSEITAPNLQYALLGLGGFGCTPGGSNPATSTPGQGPCLWFNPFSTGMPGNAHTLVQNPQYAQALALNPQVANSEEVIRYLEANPYAFYEWSRIFEANVVLDGDLPWRLWSEAPISWAAGAQYRWQQDKKDLPDATNILKNPCPMFGVTSCTTPTGVLTFFGAQKPWDLEGEVFAFFGELKIPVTDRLEAQVAIRHEDLGDIGTTTNPKLAVRWDATDFLTLRGSIGTTFKSPDLTNLGDDFLTSGGVVTQLGAFRPIDIYNNPDLQPETATTYNVGTIVDIGSFRATLDYYAIDFEGAIERDTAASMITAFFGPSLSSPNRCTSNPQDPWWNLQQRFTFTGGVGDPATCGLANLLRTKNLFTNARDYKVRGVDATWSLDLPEILDGQVQVGGDLNYIIKYEASAFFSEGIELEPAEDVAGTMNAGPAIPRWKANAYVQYTRGGHNLRLTVRYLDGMIDNRPSIFPPTSTNRFAEKIDAYVPVDLIYRVELPGDTTATLGVINLFDRDPPAARLDFAYNTYTADPLGRVYRLTLRKRF